MRDTSKHTHIHTDGQSDVENAYIYVCITRRAFREFYDKGTDAIAIVLYTSRIR